ncbi:SET-containing protein [Venustampulla echinocandica]|uniref:SET-containing protein n=1 Tax=Venustampulla echinocandica TaxID=2656787 RepID=A0A370TM32_9HELO|nr:SET-containing protein [Venustampulla echinocandica]RDL36576.1 SET-containing protein [Venustampulla echinocandica]
MVSQNPAGTSSPKNWPQNIRYITAPVYQHTLTPEQLASVRTRKKETTNSIPASVSIGPCSIVKITPISDPSHPAAGQCGLFTASNLKPGTFILQYLGKIHASPASPSLPNLTSHVDPHAGSDYDLSLDRDQGLGIDANELGNEARFVNDYRGIAEKPNAEFRDVWDERRKEKGIGVFVLPEGKSGKGKGIKKGQEILVSYGRGFWGARKDPN